jgi:hypothetical protein
MNKILTLASIAAIMFSPVAFSADTGTDAASITAAWYSDSADTSTDAAGITAAWYSDSFAGEKLGSGLDSAQSDNVKAIWDKGEMSGLAYKVPGEKIDGRLDSWQPDVQLEQNMVLSGYSAPRAKRDGGL